VKPESGLGARPSFHEDDLPGIQSAIADVLRSGRLILGPHTEALEAEFARRVGVKHAVAVASCSAALEIALRAVDVRHGEVLMPANTFVATAVAAMRAGATPVFCETDARDFCMDVDDALSRITLTTAAVVVVHLAGFIPHGFERLRAECMQRGIPLIEDCAHAAGASISTATGVRLAGGRALSDVGCFSFYPTKILTCGVGGMLTTDRDDVAKVARTLRHHGAGSSLEEIVGLGSDWLMDEMRAVLALAQLRRLDEVVAHRRKVAAVYDVLIEGVATPSTESPGTRSAYYKYPVLLPDGVDRDRVRSLMRERYGGIDCGVLYWPPVHKMPAFRDVAVGCSLPRTEDLLSRQLCLPMHAQVDPTDCAEIVEALRWAVGEARA
jgi:dTDP-4-amino-4,6-dideoxygalactose transaminase